MLGKRGICSVDVKPLIWDYFHRGERQNKSHSKAHCYGCIEFHWPSHVPITVSDNDDEKSWYLSLSSEVRFIEGKKCLHDCLCDANTVNALNS
jgi:hypothetical protein